MESKASSVTVLVDGRPVQAMAGQSVVSVLISAGIWAVGKHPVSNRPRGPFCGMGVCFECELNIDGSSSVRACITPAQDGMQILTGV